MCNLDSDDFLLLGYGTDAFVSILASVQKNGQIFLIVMHLRNQCFCWWNACEQSNLQFLFLVFYAHASDVKL